MLAAINLETSQTFGDKSKFAIYYRSRNYYPTGKMAICHLIINNKLLGDPDEECYLPSWLFSLTDTRNYILNNKELLFPNEFKGLLDREIFELILKSNQFKSEFHHDFLYLPHLDKEIWIRHSFTIDETIDSYLIYFYVKDNAITLLIKDTKGTFEGDKRSYKFQSINLDTFFNVIDEATEFLLQNYPYLKNNISTGTFNQA